VTVVIAGTRRTRYTGGENRSLLDQLAHLTVIVLVVVWTHAPSRSELAGAAVLLADPRALACAIGCTLLLNPAGVFLRLTVRGVWGSDAVSHLGGGAKYGPMVERVLIASCVLTGQFHLVPLVLLPRRLVPLRVQRFSSLSPSFGAWQRCVAPPGRRVPAPPVSGG
jgi:hypothetical protein